jgi:hypothetical protein
MSSTSSSSCGSSSSSSSSSSSQGEKRKGGHSEKNNGAKNPSMMIAEVMTGPARSGVYAVTRSCAARKTTVQLWDAIHNSNPDNEPATPLWAVTVPHNLMYPVFNAVANRLIGYCHQPTPGVKCSVMGWDVVSDQLLYTITDESFDRQVIKLMFNHFGTRFVSCVSRYDFAAHPFLVWDAENGSNLFRITQPGLFGLYFSADDMHIIGASWTGKLFVYNNDDCGNAGAVVPVAASEFNIVEPVPLADAPSLYAQRMAVFVHRPLCAINFKSSRPLGVWNYSTGERVFLQPNDSLVKAFCIGANDSTIVAMISVAQGYGLTVWDIDSGAAVYTHQLKDLQPHMCVSCPLNCGRNSIYAGRFRAIVEVDVSTGEYLSSSESLFASPVEDLVCASSTTILL